MHHRTAVRVCLSALVALTLSLPADAGWLFKRKPSMRGRIANVVATPNPDWAAKGVLGSMLVFGDPREDRNRQQVLVYITNETEIEGVQVSQKAFAVLAAGMSVEIKFADRIPSTYPVSGTAKRIKILDASYVRR